MAVATLVYANVKQGVESDGMRSVEATVTFSVPGTDTYTTTGVPIVLADLGLTNLRKAYVQASQFVDTPYTFASWQTSQNPTCAAFVDITSVGTTAAPRLVLFKANAEHTAAAINAAQAFRIKFVGFA